MINLITKENLKKIEIPHESVEKGWFGAKFCQEGEKAIWNPDGAYLDVKAGDWPIGVPSTFDKYLPK